MKTKIHYYQFSGSKDPAYKAMVETIKANSDGRGHWMNAIPTGTDRGGEAGTAHEIEVETKFLFGNQWNTACGKRVFDWYEAAVFNGGLPSDVRWGHWLFITPEMAEIRRQTVKCGYCGHHYGPHHDEIPADGFCHACLDSPFLKESDLHLLRLRPLAEQIKDVFHYDHESRAPLTEAERGALMPRYVDRQTTGADSRNARKLAEQRARLIKDYADTVAKAKAEHDGMIWLMDHGISIDNVIYYNHTGKFSFGWRTPLAKDVVSRILDVISEFPFAYEIKCDDKRTLTKE